MSQHSGPKQGTSDLTVGPNSDVTVQGAIASPPLQGDTVAPSDTSAPLPVESSSQRGLDETIGPLPAPSAAPAAKAPARGTEETIAPTDTAGGGLGATIDMPPPVAGLNVTIESIPSLSLPKTSTPSPPRPQVEGYTILSELGRGGMGVVYKARQRKLNRIVALKMVLAGAHAGQEQLARFYTEAEAVAHLQQPNIVQIHEVGEHEGLPYFSLEFVDGGSLSERIGGKPQPVAEAASMVELLARAMAYAHENGIIHRDLKPANVLLTKDGQPKITDFGLAKRLESDASQTRSGTLMGTPNYMAPEQARGMVREVGPLADVYALGVILYEMLVGRTPFLGASILDTLQQVRNQEPVPPSRLQPKVPRDLETICLKCLDKEPAKRYDSAAALADDLHRFVAGEPILARPVAAPERIWRWCQRNRKVASLMALAGVLLLSLAIGGPVAAMLISQQKTVAVRNEQAAKQAQADAERNEQQAIAARKEADENARSALVQRGLAMEALGALVTKVQGQLQNTPATQRLRQDLLRTGLEGLAKVVAESEQGKLRADSMMGEAHQRMGDIFVSLGQHAEARQQYEVSHAIRQELVKSAPAEDEPQRNLANSLHKLGDISLLEGNKELALKHYGEARTLREALAAKNPQLEAAQIDLATSYVTLGNVSEPEQQRGYYTLALKARQARAAAAPESSRANRERDVWITFNKLAELSLKLDDVEEAQRFYEQALGQAGMILELVPNIPQARIDLALSHVNLGNVHSKSGSRSGAKDAYGKAVELFRPLAKADPDVLELQKNFALALALHGDHAEAAQKAEALRKLAPQSFLNLYNVACCYALCVTAVDREKTGEQLSGDEQALQRAYADKAIAALRQAATRGLKGTAGVAGDSDLDSIRTHPDYPKLLAELK